MPSATSTLDTLGGSIVSTTVNLATTVIETYWPYILVVGVITALAVALKKFVFVGAK
jgi:hypothetical protein